MEASRDPPLGPIRSNPHLLKRMCLWKVLSSSSIQIHTLHPAYSAVGCGQNGTIALRGETEQASEVDGCPWNPSSDAQRQSPQCNGAKTLSWNLPGHAIFDYPIQQFFIAVKFRTSERRGNAEPVNRSILENDLRNDVGWYAPWSWKHKNRAFLKKQCRHLQYFLWIRKGWNVRLRANGARSTWEDQWKQCLIAWEKWITGISASLTFHGHALLSATKMHVSGAVPAHSTGHIDAIVPKGGWRNSQTCNSQKPGQYHTPWGTGIATPVAIATMKFLFMLGKGVACKLSRWLW